MPPARAHARATILTCTWLCHAARCTLGKYSAARGRSAVARKCRDKLVPSRTTRRWRVRSATPRPPSRSTASPRSPRTAGRASPSAQAQWPCVAAESGRARRAVRAERTRLTDRRCGSRAARHTRRPRAPLSGKSIPWRLELQRRQYKAQIALQTTASQREPAALSRSRARRTLQSRFARRRVPRPRRREQRAASERLVQTRAEVGSARSACSAETPW